MNIGDVLTSSGKYPERVAKWPPTRMMLNDAQVLAERVTQLLVSYSSSVPACVPELEVSSGYRPEEVNSTIKNAAKHSNHTICRAVDIEDEHGIFGKWCMANLDLLEHFELWLEDVHYTPSWVHLQIVPPKSNHRVFVP